MITPMASHFGTRLRCNQRKGAVRMIVMKAASRMGVTMDAAACRKISAMAMAAMTIKARERAEKFLNSFIF
jgi:hypothetical protein